jgi:hypothetical protein
MFTCPSSPAGATIHLPPSQMPGSQPLCGRGKSHYRQGGGPKRNNPRVGGLKAHSPRAGLVGPPGEESLGALEDVSSLTSDLLSYIFQLVLFANIAFCPLVGTPTPACSASHP